MFRLSLRTSGALFIVAAVVLTVIGGRIRELYAECLATQYASGRDYVVGTEPRTSLIDQWLIALAKSLHIPVNSRKTVAVVVPSDVALPADETFEFLTALCELKDFHLHEHPDVDASILKIAGEIRSLEFLILEGPEVTDAGLANLRNLRNLEGITLSRTQISKVGLGHLMRLPKLTFITLEETNLSPAEAKQCQPYPKRYVSIELAAGVKVKIHPELAP